MFCCSYTKLDSKLRCKLLMPLKVPYYMSLWQCLTYQNSGCMFFSCYKYMYLLIDRELSVSWVSIRQLVSCYTCPVTNSFTNENWLFYRRRGLFSKWSITWMGNLLVPDLELLVFYRIRTNKKAFQQGVYRPLMLTLCASSIATSGGWSSGEQVWTGLQSWPPDVTCMGVPVQWDPMSVGKGGGLYNRGPMHHE